MYDIYSGFSSHLIGKKSPAKTRSWEGPQASQIYEKTIQQKNLTHPWVHGTGIFTYNFGEFLYGKI